MSIHGWAVCCGGAGAAHRDAGRRATLMMLPPGGVRRRSRLQQPEPGALVVGALGGQAVGLLRGLAGLATVAAHGGQRGVEVVDVEQRLDAGLGSTA